MSEDDAHLPDDQRWNAAAIAIVRAKYRTAPDNPCAFGVCSGVEEARLWPCTTYCRKHCTYPDCGRTETVHLYTPGWLCDRHTPALTDTTRRKHPAAVKVRSSRRRK